MTSHLEKLEKLRNLTFFRKIQGKSGKLRFECGVLQPGRTNVCHICIFFEMVSGLGFLL